jgi:hypothetical protein
VTLTQLLARFPDDNASKTYLAQCRWPDGVTCPKCGNVKVWHVTHRPFHWICKQCNKNGYRFSVITQTIFENTKVPLSEWFKVILIMSQSTKGTSALQIQRMLGMGSYRTAWYLCHRIRAAMQDWVTRQAPELLDGHVDFDTVVTHILRADPDRLDIGPKRQRRTTQAATRTKESTQNRKRRRKF